jgi:hypothetical protein
VQGSKHTNQLYSALHTSQTSASCSRIVICPYYRVHRPAVFHCDEKPYSSACLNAPYAGAQETSCPSRKQQQVSRSSLKTNYLDHIIKETMSSSRQSSSRSPTLHHEVVEESRHRFGRKMMSVTAKLSAISHFIAPTSNGRLHSHYTASKYFPSTPPEPSLESQVLITGLYVGYSIFASGILPQSFTDDGK